MMDKFCDEMVIEEIASMEKQLVSCTKSELAKGVESVDTAEMAQAADMIKDLSKALKNHAEAKYYCAVTKAMEEYEEDEWDESERMGYTGGRMSRSRSSRTGRFTSGRGSRGGQTRNQAGSMKMGFTDTDEYWRDPRYEDMDDSSMPRIREMEDPRYGKAYNKFIMARKHYHDTKSATDKEEMSESAKEHMTDTVMTIKEMWKEADPELRRDMKMHLDNLIKEMNI